MGRDHVSDPRKYLVSDGSPRFHQGLERIREAITRSGSSPSARIGALNRLRSNGSTLLKMWERRYEREAYVSAHGVQRSNQDAIAVAHYAYDADSERDLGAKCSSRNSARPDPIHFIGVGLERISVAIIRSGSSPSARIRALNRLRSNGSTLLKMWGRRYEREACGSADGALWSNQDAVAVALCSYVSNSGRSLSANYWSTGGEIVAIGKCSHTVDYDLFGKSDLEQAPLIGQALSKPSPSKRATLNESSVDVEHLRGYALQHRYHL